MQGDERYMELALDLAREAGQDGEVPIGAIIVNDDRVVGRGRNAQIGRHDPTAHAEIVALRAAGEALGNYRLTGATLYVTVEPCLMCVGAALHARIGRLVYAAPDPKVGVTGRLDALRDDGVTFNHDFAIEGGVLATEAAGLLFDFFQQRRAHSTGSGQAGRKVVVSGEVPKWS